MVNLTDPNVELFLNGSWTDVTEDVRVGSGITIERGSPDESNDVRPASCRFTLENSDGRYSPRNPTGPYFGSIGRNTPVRVSTGLGVPRLVVAAASGSYVEAPDSAGLSVTGDIDLRAELRTSAASVVPIFKDDPGQLSYLLQINDDTLVLWWSSNGSTWLTATSESAPEIYPGRRVAVRATLDVNNGAGGRTATFYVADSIGGTWRQIGDPVVQAGTTSIFNGTASVGIDGNAAGDELFAVEIRNGIGGTLVASPDFTAQTPGVSSFADAQGNTWTMVGDAEITKRRWRFHGEVSSWPVAWNLAGTLVDVGVEASGIGRRLAQGDALRSAVYRGVLAIGDQLRAYWPFEDGPGSLSIASGLSGGSPMRIIGSPDFADDEATVPASKALARLRQARMVGSVPSHTATGEFQVRWVMDVPSADVAVADQILLRIRTTGTVVRWDFLVGTTGGLVLRGYNVEGTLVEDTGVGFDVRDLALIGSLEFAQDGADIDWTIQTVDVDPVTDAGLGYSDTTTGQTLGTVLSVEVNPATGLDLTIFGHLHVVSDITGSPEKLIRGYIPETAGRRIERLCSEEGIAFVGLGLLGPSNPDSIGDLGGRWVPMGPQEPTRLLEVLQDAAAAETGLLAEARGVFGYAYRPSQSTWSQVPALTVPYAEHVQELAPAEDDQGLANDVTAQRRGGSSARSVLEEGPLSVLEPPDGVGAYPVTATVNVQVDEALPDQASWRLHLGTVDEPRYPVIGVDLAAPAFLADVDLTTRVMDLDLGDLVVVEDPPAWLPPDDVRQVVLGLTERIFPWKVTVEAACIPASGFDVLVPDHPDWSRADGENTNVSGAVNSTQTSLTVVTDAGSAPWVNSTDHPDEFPFDIAVGGERMTVTAISGASSPQTFTVTRSVNGVVKSHASGSAVRLFRPVYFGL